MHLRNWKIFGLFLLLVIIQIGCNNASILDYFCTRPEISSVTMISTPPGVPFEENDIEENFIRDIAKILGNKLSDLDFCQQRVILKLKNSCKSLTDEELGKLGIALLNCQLINEGRPSLECSDVMNLKECTESMTPEVWNNYNLFVGRTKSVCLLIRQDQFRGLTEITINRLMESVRQHLQMIEELKENQKQIKESALNSIDDITQSTVQLMENQKELLQLSGSQRITAEINLKNIRREKQLIKNSQVELLSFLTDLRVKAKEGLLSIQNQNNYTREIINELIKDVTKLQETATKISNHLDDVDSSIMLQNKRASEQLEETILQLKEANKIASELTQKVVNFLKDFLSHIGWLRKHLGDDDKFAKRLGIVIIHVTYLLIGMICLIFVNADSFSRFMFFSVISLNMTAILHEFIEMDLNLLTEVIATLLMANFLVKISMNVEWRKYFPINKLSPSKVKVSEQNSSTVVENRNDHTNNTHDLQAHIIYNGGVRRNSVVYSNNHGLRRNEYIRSEPNFTTRSVIEGSEEPPTMIFREIQEDDDDEESSRSRSSTPFSNSRKRCKGITTTGSVCRMMTPSSSTDFCRIHERQSVGRN